MAFENYGGREGVTLPNHVTEKSRNNDNVTEEIKKRVEAEARVAKLEKKPKKKSRASYMRDYRRKVKVKAITCPHCGKNIRA